MNQEYDHSFMTTQYIEAIEHGLRQNMNADEIADLLKDFDSVNFASRVREALETCLTGASESGNDRYERLVDLKSYVVEPDHEQG